MTPEQRRKLGKRNFYKMIIDGSLFWMAAAFIEPTAVVSVFIDEYTGSMQLAGLAMTLRQAGPIVGAFFMGMFVHRVDDHGAFFRKFALLLRSPYWLVLPPLLLGVGGEAMVACFLAAQAAFFLADGFLGISWQSINANTILSRDRGLIQGYQQVISAIVGIVSAAVIKLLMDSPLAPNHRYAVIFGLCALVYTANALVQRTLKDAPHEETAPPPRSFSRYIGNFLALWKGNREFRHILYGRALFMGGVMGTSLLVLFGSRDMGLSLTQVSSMIYVQIAGQLLGGLFWGYLNRHLGNDRTMALCNLPSLVVGVLGIVLYCTARGSGLFWPVAAMVFVGSTQGVAYMGFVNAVFDRMPRAYMPAYLVLQQLVLLPFTALPYLAGVLAQTAGFLPLFALVALFGAAGSAYCIAFARRSLRKEADKVPAVADELGEGEQGDGN